MAETFNIFLIVMAVLAAGVYVALHFFEAGYGYLFNPKYGPPVPNKVGWVVMESPVFIAMCVLWLMSGGHGGRPLALFVLFQAHYPGSAPSSSRCCCAESRRCRWGSS